MAAASSGRQFAGKKPRVVSEMAIFQQLSELNCCSAVLIDLAQDRVVLVTTESEAHTKLIRQPPFRDSVAIKFLVQEEVKRAIVPLDYFENPVCDWRVFLSSAHAAPRQGYEPAR
jgi:hypothetical protein